MSKVCETPEYWQVEEKIYQQYALETLSKGDYVSTQRYAKKAEDAYRKWNAMLNSAKAETTWEETK